MSVPFYYNLYHEFAYSVKIFTDVSCAYGILL